MRAIRGFVLVLLTVLLPPPLVAAEGVDQGYPKCAVDCIFDILPRSACASNITTECICTDAPFQDQTTLCITANCTVKESLVSKNISNTACGVPVRNRGAVFDTIQIALGSITGGVVIIRLVFKTLVTRKLTSDDYVFVLLTLLATPNTVITHFGTVANGVGRDIWTLTPQNINDFLFYFYIETFIYFFNVMLNKLCLLLFYLRIFPGRTVRYLLLGTITFAVLYGVVFFFLGIFQCWPVSHVWLHWDGEHEGKCLNLNAIAWSNAAISIALDLWMLVIPLAQLKNLTLHWRKKVGVALMFFVGTFVTVVSIIRIPALVTLGRSNNPTWDNFEAGMWSTIEVNVGIICICMPTLRLVLVRLFPTLGNSAGGYQQSSGGQKLSDRIRKAQGHTNQDLGLKLDGTQSATPVTFGLAAGGPLGKLPGVVRQQTFAVPSDDDEASLVHMQDLDGRRQTRADRSLP